MSETTQTTDELKTNLFDAVAKTSGVDYLQITVDGDEAHVILCGRDASTEHANEGEPLATVSTHDGGASYAVQYGAGEAQGYTVTDLQATGLSLKDALAMAAERVR